MNIDHLVFEKVNQAAGLLERYGVDLWLIPTQETGYECDPVYPLVMGDRDIARGWLLLTRQGGRIAIVGGLDEAIPASTGVWDDVRVAVDAAAALRTALDEFNPASIGVNYSRDNPSADGLSYGGYLRLMDALKGTVYASRVVSADKLVLGLRAVKSPEEIKRIRAAIGKTGGVYCRLREYLRPGLEGLEIYRFIQDQITELGASCAWSRHNCPVLTMGPAEYMGHTPPPAGRIWEPGQLLQVDLGLRYNGYCSDFQRMFYALKDGEDNPPEAAGALFDHVHRGITEMIGAIRPGIRNDSVSELGFSCITGAGFTEPKYSAGHQLGRAVHDGGAGLLHFRRPRPECVIEQGNVFTVEGLETRLPPWGWVSLEEDVAVTADGCEVLTDRQNEIWCCKNR